MAWRPNRIQSSVWANSEYFVFSLEILILNILDLVNDGRMHRFSRSRGSVFLAFCVFPWKSNGPGLSPRFACLVLQSPDLGSVVPPAFSASQKSMGPHAWKKARSESPGESAARKFRVTRHPKASGEERSSLKGGNLRQNEHVEQPIAPYAQDFWAKIAKGINYSVKRFKGTSTAVPFENGSFALFTLVSKVGDFARPRRLWLSEFQEQTGLCADSPAQRGRFWCLLGERGPTALAHAPAPSACHWWHRCIVDGQLLCVRECCASYWVPFNPRV